MEQEDKDFFVLVLGVLAAIILVVSWWFTTGGVGVDSTTRSVPAAAPTPTSLPEPAAADDDEEAQAPAPTPVATQSPDPTAEPTPIAEREPALPPTVFDAIAADPALSVVTGLLRDEGLDAALAGAGPFTVLAPSDDAISQAGSSDTTITVLAEARPSVLTYHVIPGKYTFDELVELARGSRSAQLTTLQGEPLTLTLNGPDLVLNGDTSIREGAQQADNGVVHTLDNVLLPPVASLNVLVEREPILFASGSAEIQAASTATLDQFISVLAGSDARVSIEGHTDSSGDPILNQDLSQDRARAVLNYLVANGVDETQLTAIGFGSSKPVADNDSEEGRALNRRIEFTLN